MHLVVIFGPPAAGKMTVGHELTRLTGLVFTYVWALEDEGERRMVQEYVDIVESRGGRVSFVELVADQAERLIRNATEFRLEQKRSKRDLEFSRNNLLQLDAQYVMNTGPVPTTAEALFEGRGYLRIENTELSAADVAARVVAAFDLPRLE